MMDVLGVRLRRVFDFLMRRTLVVGLVLFPLCSLWISLAALDGDGFNYSGICFGSLQALLWFVFLGLATSAVIWPFAVFGSWAVQRVEGNEPRGSLRSWIAGRGFQFFWQLSVVYLAYYLTGYLVAGPGFVCGVAG